MSGPLPPLVEPEKFAPKSMPDLCYGARGGGAAWPPPGLPWWRFPGPAAPVRVDDGMTLQRYPRHHPDADLLLAYAGGTLPEVKALFVATHLALCPTCRARNRAFEAQCGDWLEACAPDEGDAAGMDDLLAAVLGRIDAGVGEGPVPARSPPLPDMPWLPEPLRSYRGLPERGGWEEFAPGVALSAWGYEASGTSARLLRMAPGAAVPAHHHTATEGLLVLAGSFADEGGRFARGDAVTYPAGTDHHASGTGEADCVCLLVLDGPLRFLEE